MQSMTEMHLQTGIKIHCWTWA